MVWRQVCGSNLVRATGFPKKHKRVQHYSRSWPAPGGCPGRGNDRAACPRGASRPPEWARTALSKIVAMYRLLLISLTKFWVLRLRHAHIRTSVNQRRYPALSHKSGEERTSPFTGPFPGRGYAMGLCDGCAGGGVAVKSGTAVVSAASPPDGAPRERAGIDRLIPGGWYPRLRGFRGLACFAGV